MSLLDANWLLVHFIFLMLAIIPRQTQAFILNKNVNRYTTFKQNEMEMKIQNYGELVYKKNTI